MKYFKADLHIHTCLSPCGDWEMTPSGIIRQASRQDLDMIAICDHNTAENVAATMRAGMKAGIRVLAGMEVCSKEEVHLLGIFDRADQALALQTAVYNNLEGENRPDVFGFQVIANENNEALGENPRRLIGATLLKHLRDCRMDSSAGGNLHRSPCGQTVLQHHQPARIYSFRYAAGWG